MKRVSETEARNRLDAILDEAQQEPIVIGREGVDIAVLLSFRAYERLRLSNVEALFDIRDRMAAEAAANGLTEERLIELLADDENSPRS